MNSVSPSSVQYLSTGEEDLLRPEPSRFLAHSPSRGEKNYNGYFNGAESPSQNEALEVDKIKSKLISAGISAWNNVKYGWTVKTKTNFSRTSPLYLLGHCYSLELEDDIEAFKKDFVTRLWLTYRREFPQLEGSIWTTDCGWGCMLRSGQMLLAQGLMAHFLTRGWTWPDSLAAVEIELEPFRPRSFLKAGVSSSRQVPTAQRGRNRRTQELCAEFIWNSQDAEKERHHRNIISWFGDHPAASFGVHQLVEHGKSSGKKAGDWYGPSIVAHIIRRSVEEACETQDLTVYVAQDCTVYKADVIRLCEQTPAACDSNLPAKGKSVIILVPVRLGGETLNPVYMSCVKEIFKLEWCVGIIGGKPKHSLYFIGFQDDFLLYLDPHYCQSVVDVTKDNFPLESFHCTSPRKMALSKMDPSCTIGFYARNKTEFEALCVDVTRVLNSSAFRETYSIFTFAEGHAQDYRLDDLCSQLSEQAVQVPNIGKRGKAKRPSTEDFVFL
ncbi:cysteine protease ATG4D isoform X1 [Latimeria chalumnae]|uniref:cysteine protease ATG4D isoform X1 n=1 Tax=Latimeria chalumnae TaxID=7897 RepID=UPI0006D93EB4|nr:PREDICTED: cysteine protease ATG4D isoform X1 [Latimeria chalumnae]XP_014342788.1 PREDICTED: cysteine protease ATG4D isoform X1 [Latimeria chalumnae]XP_014342789.1 PREDICTED: cysteine protease ATG4D isoform X1 [Latimeria chalumnae]XP_014342790.1 PREDICTED: cysteine protease ATG4D isoform X1 [Latimeria chalumnae]XP_014342791.1 PREDICTED: cysteine protease ATG4D isoform X1 [Latimeria chalumnae]XP_014342792.1 PREDICTED: cysteine protease ATG4D isoform X1 [Latimeria chalumnae]XP_014342793.1 PR|eukprot:XP_005994173.2 PREDICTED: cysteine protease ATG4D isoform X1 [Latimeria chalumnae]